MEEPALAVKAVQPSLWITGVIVLGGERMFGQLLSHHGCLLADLLRGPEQGNATMNSVQLIGRLTRDPEMEHTANGTPVTVFRLAVDHPRRKLANFVTIKAWGRLAEVTAEHLVRGRSVAVWGQLEHDEWTGSDGRRAERLTVVADRVEFLDPPRRKAGDELDARRAATAPPPRSTARRA